MMSQVKLPDYGENIRGLRSWLRPVCAVWWTVAALVVFAAVGVGVTLWLLAIAG